MPNGLTYLSYEDWVYFTFDHPAEGPQWYCDETAAFWNGPAKLTCEYVTRLFDEPFPALEGYSDAEPRSGKSPAEVRDGIRGDRLA